MVVVVAIVDEVVVVEGNSEVVVDRTVVGVVELAIDAPHPASDTPAKAATTVVTKTLLTRVIGAPCLHRYFIL